MSEPKKKKISAFLTTYIYLDYTIKYKHLHLPVIHINNLET